MGAKRKRRHFTPEYKAEVVRLARTSGKVAGQIARELALTCRRSFAAFAASDDARHLQKSAGRIVH